MESDRTLLTGGLKLRQVTIVRIESAQPVREFAASSGFQCGLHSECSADILNL
jgi:hypothetical protein